MPEAGHSLRRRHQAGVGRDDPHGSAVVEIPRVGAGHRGVEDPEAVLTTRDPHHRPRHPVDADDVAVEALLVAAVEEQGAVGVEHQVRDDEGHVVLTVRNRQGTLERVMHLVLPGQTHVDVLRSVVEPVVVVPEGARRLPVRVAVVLPVTGVGDVAGIAVVLRQGGRPVQVDRGPRRVPELRVNGGQVVDLTHHDLAAALRVEGGTRDRPVVPPHRRGQPGDHLDRRRPHLDPVVVGGRVGPHRSHHRWDPERQGERRRQSALGDPVREHQRLGDGPLQGQRHGRPSQHREFHDVSSCQFHYPPPGARFMRATTLGRLPLPTAGADAKGVPRGAGAP